MVGIRQRRDLGRGCAAAIALLALFGAGAGRGQDAGSNLAVAYVESTAAQTGAAFAGLRDYARSQRQGPGAPKVLALREIGRPGRMVLIEAWPASGAAPAADDVAEALQAQLGGKLQAPVDERLNALITPPIAGPIPPGALHVLLHIDVVPEGAKMAADRLAAQARAARAAPGGLGFEVGVQTNRANHFAVHEVWASRAAYDAYTASPVAQAMRRQLATVKGAPFDDRFYSERP